MIINGVYNLTIESTSYGNLTVKYSDARNFIHWKRLQRRYCWQILGNDTSFANITERQEIRRFEMLTKALSGISENAKILDIGSGIATSDLFLSLAFPKTTYYLIDKEGQTIPNSYFQPDNQDFIHSWEPVTDAIQTTGLEPSRFTFLDPDDDWPEKVDFIFSLGSYCWHYPLQTYWDKIRNNLNVGGKFLCTISAKASDSFRDTTGRDIFEYVSEEFGFNTIKKYDKTYDEIPEGYEYNSVVSGITALWERKR